MLKLLSSLFSLLNKLFSAYQESEQEKRGRQQVQEELDHNVAKAEEAVATPDAARDERLRTRFDSAAADHK
jgi:hypothetical protein